MFGFSLLRAALPKLSVPSTRPPLLPLRFIQSASANSSSTLPLPSKVSPKLIFLIKSNAKNLAAFSPHQALEASASTLRSRRNSRRVYGIEMLGNAIIKGIFSLAREIRTGIFTLAECENVHAAIELEAASHARTPSALVFLKEGESKIDVRGFWRIVAASVPMRSQAGVRAHARKRYSQASVTGPWSPEEDFRIESYVLVNGPGSWSPLAKELGRTGRSCSVRWSELQDFARSTKSGPWTDAEITRLADATNDSVLKRKGGKHLRSWIAVSEAVGTRSAQQCAGRFLRQSSRPRKDLPKDSSQSLVSAVAAQGVQSVSEVKWDDIKIDIQVKRPTSVRPWSHPTSRTLYKAWSRLILAPVSLGILDHQGVLFLI
ncbi:hypothetical protein P7C70_g6999, partial [Phenoliferia sp. Uapishka_3]